MNTGDNLHRVVIYRDGADLALRHEPYTTLAPLGSPDPNDHPGTCLYFTNLVYALIN